MALTDSKPLAVWWSATTPSSTPFFEPGTPKASLLRPKGRQADHVEACLITSRLLVFARCWFSLSRTRGRNDSVARSAFWPRARVSVKRRLTGNELFGLLSKARQDA